MAKVKWTVEGKLFVEESEIAAGDRQLRPLVNVEVEVMAANFGAFDSWGTVRTNEQGYFCLVREKDKSKRKFRLKVRFEDAKLKVVTGFLTNPVNLEGPQLEFFETANEIEGPRVSAGSRTFKTGASGDLGVQDNIRQAIAWAATHELITTLESRDPYFAFGGKVHVVYPANTPSAQAYANGVTRCAYIHHGPKNSSWSVATLFHEVMHLWNYDHNRGTANWFGAVFCPPDMNTHALTERPNIAFHEGFAEYAAHDLLFELYGGETNSGRKKLEPHTRRYLFAEEGLRDLAAVEQNDDGVTNALRVLTANELYDLRFGKSDGTGASGSDADRVESGMNCPASPNLTVWDVLKVFQANEGAGWPTEWQVGATGYGVTRFFERAADVLRGFDEATKNLMLELIDPSSEVEPSSRCTAKVVSTANRAEPLTRPESVIRPRTLKRPT